MSDPTAAAPWTATLAYTPGQNGGAVSMLDGRVSLPAVMGLLAAGEPPEVVAAEYNCTVEAARVIAQLLEDFHDGLFDDSDEDPKHRGPSWRRGYVDGFNACRAGVSNPTEENPDRA